MKPPPMQNNSESKLLVVETATGRWLPKWKNLQWCRGNIGPQVLISFTIPPHGKQTCKMVLQLQKKFNSCSKCSLSSCRSWYMAWAGVEVSRWKYLHVATATSSANWLPSAAYTARSGSDSRSVWCAFTLCISCVPLAIARNRRCTMS